jgi:hypothetical protein
VTEAETSGTVFGKSLTSLPEAPSERKLPFAGWRRFGKPFIPAKFFNLAGNRKVYCTVLHQIQTRRGQLNITLDKKTKCWFARWRTVLPDGKVKHSSVRLMPRSKTFHSKSDVRKSEEYKAIAERIGEGNTDSTQAKLLLAVAEARGKAKPDAADAAVINRVIADDKANNMLLTTFVDSAYFPFAEANLRGKTVREYKSIWNRYAVAAKVSGLRVCDFRTKHGSEILESIATEHGISKSTLQRVKFMLSAVFVLALNRGLCDSNPVQGVMLPKARGARQTYAYELNEILAMLRLPFDAKTKAAIGVAAFAALRESEIAGLHWGDYDGETITVRRSIDRVSGTANAPKNGEECSTRSSNSDTQAAA